MIQITDLKKNYPGFSLELSMTVAKGARTALVGKNGAGKTTLLKIILGLVYPNSGTVQVLGKPVQTLTAADRRAMGVALAEAGWPGSLRVQDIAPILNGLYPDFDAAEFQKLCTRMELPGKKRVKELSTGLRARLRLVTALSHPAELLVLDEPTAGMDVAARQEILDLIRSYHDNSPQTTVLISSHIGPDLEMLCRDAWLLREGRLVLHRPMEEILAQGGIDSLVLGTEGGR